jgi:hypothetical protein
MGSVMDQERPWESERRRETIRERIKDSFEFGQGSAIDQIIAELERLEAALKAAGMDVPPPARG